MRIYIMAILVDFSQVVLSSCYAFGDVLSINNPDSEQGKDLIRHVILSQLKFYNTKYKSQYGKLIVCCDGRHYWRRDIFPYYKACRKKAREESNLNWKLIFEVIDQTIIELQQNFTFPIIRLDSAESDDVIATLTEYFQNNEKVEKGIFGFAQPVLIVSSDKDFVQLHKYDNVKQISPRTKQLVRVDDPVFYLTEKVLKGDRGDGIPSVLNEDDSFVNHKKCSIMTKKRIEKLLNEGFENCSDQQVKQHWMRNKQLIDFQYIPDQIKHQIIEQYKKPVEGNKVKIFNYLLNNKCNVLLKDISSLM